MTVSFSDSSRGCTWYAYQTHKRHKAYGQHDTQNNRNKNPSSRNNLNSMLLLSHPHVTVFLTVFECAQIVGQKRVSLLICIVGRRPGGQGVFACVYTCATPRVLFKFFKKRCIWINETALWTMYFVLQFAGNMPCRPHKLSLKLSCKCPIPGTFCRRLRRVCIVCRRVMCSSYAAWTQVRRGKIKLDVSVDCWH